MINRQMTLESRAQRNATANSASLLMRGFSMEATLPNQVELEAPRHYSLHDADLCCCSAGSPAPVRR